MKHVLGFFALITLATALSFGQTTGNGNNAEPSTPTTNQAATNPQTATTDIDRARAGSGNWGWLGLIGLFGLAGLGGRRRNELIDRDRNVPPNIRRAA